MLTEKEIKAVLDRWNSNAIHPATVDFWDYRPDKALRTTKLISPGDLTLRMTRPDQQGYLTILCLGVSFIDSPTHIENVKFHIYENCSGWVVEGLKAPTENANSTWGATYIQADTIEIIDNETLQVDKIRR
jgi:hypothetical protein